jgi:hypothetical protein
MSNKQDFAGALQNNAKFTCVANGVLNGEGVYHVLAIHDDDKVAVKFYERSRREWIYFFAELDQLWNYYKRDWIEIRRG